MPVQAAVACELCLRTHFQSIKLDHEQLMDEEIHRLMLTGIGHGLGTVEHCTADGFNIWGNALMRLHSGAFLQIPASCGV